MTNAIELIGIYGSDKTHALSAWTSTSRELSQEKEERIPDLIRMLIKAGHHTPFEKSSIHFLVTAEIASHIHLLKHRIGVSINGESARYKELKEDKFHIPIDWPEQEQQELTEHCLYCFDKYHKTLQKLTPILGKKRAKESARFYLPYSAQLTFDVMFNFRSFMHFLSLRKKPEAQTEIKDIAEEMLTLVQSTGLFTYSVEAFQDYILEAPSITKFEMNIVRDLISSLTAQGAPASYGVDEVRNRLTALLEEQPDMGKREKTESKLLELILGKNDASNT